MKYVVISGYLKLYLFLNVLWWGEGVGWDIFLFFYVRDCMVKVLN